MVAATKVLLISIHPEHAQKIFGGTKSVELRRIKPKVSTGDLVLVYVSSPTKSLLGAFEVQEVVEDTPSRLWRTIGRKSGVTREKFNAYYDNTSRGYGILIQKAWMLPEAISLASLRDRLPGFHPPQCYRYLNTSEMQQAGIYSQCS